MPKITDLPTITSVTGDDYVLVVDSPATSPVTKKVAISNFFATGVSTATVINAKTAFGALGDGTTDDTVALNAALAEGITSHVPVYLPPGRYKITDTLWITPEASTFKSNTVIGAGAGFSPNDAPTIIDASSIKTKPALNIQNCRGVYLKDFMILGGNTSYESTPGLPQILTYNYTGYVASGFRDSQYSPYCGIAIDAGAGSTPPDGGYPGLTYLAGSGGSGSSTITVDNVRIRQFVVGLMHNSEIDISQGDSVVVINPGIQDCKVCIASGQGQARGFEVIGGSLGWCQTVSSSQQYGNRSGANPSFNGTQMGPGYQMIEHDNQIGTTLLVNVRAESIHRIGSTSAGGATTGYPTVFIDTDIHLLNNQSYGKPAPLVLDSESSVTMIGGAVIADGVAPPAIWMRGIPLTLMGTQVQLGNEFRPYIGNPHDFNYATALQDVRLINGAGSGAVIYGGNGRTPSLRARESQHWTQDKIRAVGSNLYQYKPQDPYGANGYLDIATASAFVFTDTTLTFNLTDTSYLMLGDVLLWDFLTAQLGNPAFQSTTKRGPGLKVTDISGTTITCELLYTRAYYDETFAPSSVSILVHQWAPGQALTGDTHNSVTITNLSPTTILQIGDWVAGADLQALTRATNIVGTTVTLNKTATGTTVGMALYWGRMTTPTLTAAF